jgi:hypothetical protein
MSSYQPIPPLPDDVKQPAQYTYSELLDLAQALSEAQPFVLLQVLNVAPDKPRDGMVVLADGTNWNPGSGAGFYGRSGGAWVKF